MDAAVLSMQNRKIPPEEHNANVRCGSAPAVPWSLTSAAASSGHPGRRRTIMGISEFDPRASDRRAWNTGRKVGAKRALEPRQVWAIRFFLDSIAGWVIGRCSTWAVDSKLRGCDVVRIKIGNLVIGGQIRTRAIVVQQKTGRPVQFELLTDARARPNLAAFWAQVIDMPLDPNGMLSTRRPVRPRAI
jgi:hypothetical protein